MINFDANASNPILETVSERLVELLKFSGIQNASSVHQGGQKSKRIIEDSRARILEILGLNTFKLIFTSGATESNNLSLHQILRHPKFISGVPFNIVISAVEHPCVVEPAMYLASLNNNLEVRIGYFKESVLEIENIVDEDTIFLSVMAANNETGEIYEIKELFERVKRRFSKNIIIHSDFVQAVGKIELSRVIDKRAPNIDLITFSGHKFGGLMGVGCLLYKDLYPMLHGGGQEHWLRAGTENILGIDSMRVALSSVIAIHDDFFDRSLNYKKVLLQELSHFGVIEPMKFGAQLPNTLCLRVPGVDSKALVVALDLAGLMVSSGSACSSGKVGNSRVLQNRGIDYVHEIIRISFPIQLTEEQFNAGLEILRRVIQRVK